MKRFFYFSLMLVLIFCGTGYDFGKSLHTGQALPAKAYASSEDTLYSRGGTPIYVVQEKIEYAYKVEDHYYNPYNLPGYLSTLTCGITAGGNIIGYYDRIYEELIPNHMGRVFLGRYIYGNQDNAVDAMFSDLYTAMGATPAGVTINGYLTGISSYVSSKGRNTAHTNAMSGPGTLNSTQYKTAIQNGDILSVFLEGFTVMDTIAGIQTFSGYDTTSISVLSGAHVMSAYGYRDISYYNSANQCFRKDSYIYACSGYSSPLLCLVKLNQYCVIDDGYITNIY